MLTWYDARDEACCPEFSEALREGKYDARDEACCPLRLPETAHKARTAAGLGTSMGRSRRRDSRQGTRIP